MLSVASLVSVFSRVLRVLRGIVYSNIVSQMNSGLCRLWVLNQRPADVKNSYLISKSEKLLMSVFGRNRANCYEKNFQLSEELQNEIRTFITDENLEKFIRIATTKVKRVNERFIRQ